MITLSKEIHGKDQGFYVSLENVHLEGGLKYDVKIELSEQPSLRPCPFCNKDKHLSIHKPEVHDGGYYVYCMWCQSMGPEEHTKLRAIDAWNGDMIPNEN